MIDPAILAAIPGAVESVEPLPGGLTNDNRKVTTDAGCFVVRTWSDDTGLLSIDREHERVNSERAAATGVGPPLVAHLPEHNTMVFAFLEGQTLSAEDLRTGAHLDAVATACRTLHTAEPFAGDFDMLALQPRYREIVHERGFRVPDRYDDFAPQVEAIAAALRARPEPRVPCNNDLLAENFILDGDRVRIIDYEYGGNNEASFELGNVWSESDLSLAQLEALTTAYWREPRPDKVARARLWGLMSKYGWTLWASIQDGVSTIDFDFWAWGLEKHHRAVAEFEDPGFGALLDAVR